MIQAIIDGRNWKKANTEVEAHPSGNNEMRVFLHGSNIASYKDGNLYINHCGWQTVTTKSRLNALIKFVLGGTCHLGQRNFEWFLFKTTSKDADTYVTTSTPIPNGWLLV